MSVPDDLRRLAQAAQSARAKRSGESASLPPGATDRDIDAFEARYAFAVPTELRDWLLFTNGPHIGRTSVRGIQTSRSCDEIDAVWETDWLERGWIPIAGDGCGSYYVLATHPDDGPGHPVFFVDHERQSNGEYSLPTYVCASGLWSFLRFYIQEDLGVEGWPFNRDMVLAADPDLADYSRVPRAWEVEEADRRSLNQQP